MSTETRTQLDEFTRAYIEVALWSSTGEPFGDCIHCGESDKLLYWNPETRKHDACKDCTTDEERQQSPWEPNLDEHYSVSDISDAAMVKIIADCEKFQEENIEHIAWDNLVRFPHRETTHQHAGHDFWLTRNGHGAGFWDGDWREPAATLLTASAKKFGECNLYPGDDGQLYI